jgi:P-type Ca2+ transporter type 2C
VSFGSSGTSLPSTAMASSDVGEPNIESRNLIKAGSDEEKIPNNPFAFTPKQLTKLHDPKDLNVLRGLGGMYGLAYGLRTDVKTGLSPDEDMLEGQISLQDVYHAVETRRKEDVKNGVGNPPPEAHTKSTAPGPSQGGEPSRRDSVGRKFSLGSRLPTNASTKESDAPKRFSDRVRVFAENRIPSRPPKSILQLMWLALHDKTLVSTLTCSQLILDSPEHCSRRFPCTWHLSKSPAWS